MAIKGTATIELTNADGSKEIIKHDNIITNAVRDLLTAKCGEMPPLFQIVNNGDSYAKALFGGILLFNDTLDNDPDNYYFPSVDVTGYASQDAYAGLDIARGSFNPSEGGVQADGSYKFVWDFATSQANGQIQSIALCPNIMGQIGMSDYIVSSEKKNFYRINDITEPFNKYGYTLPGGNTESFPDSYYCAVAVVGDIIYAIQKYNICYDSGYASSYIKNNGGVLRLYKFKGCINNVSLSDKVGRSKYLGYEDVQLPTDFINVLPASKFYAVTYSFDYHTGVLVIHPCRLKSDIAVNGSTKYVEIELKNNMNVTIKTFTNTTAGTLKAQNDYTLTERKFCNLYIGRDYILAFAYVTDTKKGIYVINKSDNTDVKEITYSKNYLYWNDSSGSDKVYISVLYECGNIIVFKVGRYNQGSYPHFVLDCSTGMAKATNILNMSDFNNLDIGNKAVFASTGQCLNFRTLVNPFVLTTKNNLDTPVTKTASQTMKITYTLSETE